MNRRTFLTVAASAATPSFVRAQGQLTWPRVSEGACPLEIIEPISPDGHRGLAVLRRPPGAGPKPAIVWLHTGMTSFPRAALEANGREAANPLRFLAAGYVLVMPTHRDRDQDPQTPLAVNDCLAVLSHVRRLPYVDAKSVVVFGCSGGGDMALEIAAADTVAATVCEEPASMMFTGIFNKDFPRKGPRLTPPDSAPIWQDPLRYYSQPYRELTRAKVSRIRTPILILLGGEPYIDVVNEGGMRFNSQVLIPELRAAGKTVEVITYPNQPHCFCSVGGNPKPPDGIPWVPALSSTSPTPPPSYPTAALKAYRDIEAFCRPRLPTQPKPIEARWVEEIPL